MEVWKDIDGYNGLYAISNFGNVKSIKRNIVMIPQKRNHGYLSICLYKNGDRQTLSVHRLVANAFCSKPVGATEINHIDENKQNNRADNLEWCTHVENSNYGTRRKRISKANTNGKRSKRVLQ